MTRLIRFNEQRTFGVEIEFVLDHSKIRSLEALLNRKGINTYYEGYTHRVSNHWKIVTDSSCGFELVSPPIKGYQGFADIKTATEALAEIGAKITVKCGVHVHHDVNDFNIKQMANVFALYTKLEKTLDTLVPQSRRANNNTYSKSLFNYRSQQEVLDKLRNVKTAEQLSSIWRTRYVKVNFQSYVKYGTIEFRHHSGTIEYEKIYNWILLTQQIIEASATGIQKTYKEENDTLESMRNVLRLIPAKGASPEIAEMFKWYKERAKKLAA